MANLGVLAAADFKALVINALSSLAPQKFEGWKLPKDIERKVHEVFSQEQPNILYLCHTNKDFCEELFRLVAGETIDAEYLVTLGLSVKKRDSRLFLNRRLLPT